MERTLWVKSSCGCGTETVWKPKQGNVRQSTGEGQQTERTRNRLCALAIALCSVNCYQELQPARVQYKTSTPLYATCNTTTRSWQYFNSYLGESDTGSHSNAQNEWLINLKSFVMSVIISYTSTTNVWRTLPVLPLSDWEVCMRGIGTAMHEF
jgi:hypothetical protein